MRLVLKRPGTSAACIVTGDKKYLELLREKSGQGQHRRGHETAFKKHTVEPHLHQGIRRVGRTSRVPKSFAKRMLAEGSK